MSDILALSVEKFVPVHPRIVRGLRTLGIHTVRDLLYHFPRRYEDYSKIKKIADLHQGEVATLHGEIITVGGRFAWGGRKMTIIEAVIRDESGSIQVLWFNQHYLLKTLRKGQFISISGKVGFGKKGLYIQHPEYEIIPKVGNGLRLRHTGRLVPIYPQTYGTSSRWLRFLIQTALEKLPKTVPDILPPSLLRKEGFLTLSASLQAIHFPKNNGEAEKAEKRFRFEELLLLQLKKQEALRELRTKQAPSIAVDTGYLKFLIDALPFSLTRAQQKCILAITKDLQNAFPMNRLVNGDVGSGKTIIAFLAALLCIRRGWQVLYMAPTEILARQHFQTFLKFFSNQDISVGLCTSSEKTLVTKVGVLEKADIGYRAREGDINILIGTHALITDSLKFKDIGLVIIDEQHRFGVEQRAKLLRIDQTGKKDEIDTSAQKQFYQAEQFTKRSGTPHGTIPHLLSMTATPIPRTLALTIYGDLDISILDELPPGRKKIITKIVRPARRPAAYQFIEEEIKKGRQAFVICPRIEQAENNESPIPSATGGATGQAQIKPLPRTEAEGNQELRSSYKKRMSLDVKTVKEEYEKLSKKVFPHRRIAFLHGKLKPKEKEKVMREFKEGLYDILVSTSVIEVGVDVPNASIMMIEGAEKFGLASLHQFRGRVGRGEHQSYCLLFPSSEIHEWNTRLKAVATSENGFELAEKDLAIRGPGNLVGLEQSGFHEPLQQALMDFPLVEKTAIVAATIMNEDPDLKKYPLLKERMGHVRFTLHAE